MTIVKKQFQKKWFLDKTFIILWFISGLIIALSLYHQYVGKIEPCTLCKWQRLLYLFIFCVSPFAFLQRFNQCARVALSILFFSGLSLAIYHTFVQFGWLADRCSITHNVENMNDFMNMLEQPKVSCSMISWQLFGLSASIYNAFFSIIALVCLNLTKLLNLRHKKYVN